MNRKKMTGNWICSFAILFVPMVCVVYCELFVQGVMAQQGKKFGATHLFCCHKFGVEQINKRSATSNRRNSRKKKIWCQKIWCHPSVCLTLY